MFAVSIREIIVDSGFIVALFHETDSANFAANALEVRLGNDFQFVTTGFVVQEIFWLLRKRVNNQKALEFMCCVKDKLIQVPFLPENWAQKVTALLHKYADRELDLADASIIVLADHLNLGDVASVDFKDFEVLRWSDGKKQFNNFMLGI
jgi:uncharacterized protein